MLLKSCIDKVNKCKNTGIFFDDKQYKKYTILDR